MIGNFSNGRSGARRQLDKSDNFLASFHTLNGSSDHRGPHHRWMSIQHRLNFGGIDVHPETHDQFLGAPDDEEMPTFQLEQGREY